MKVKQILELLDEMCPPELAESYDNVGLLAGHPDQEVDTVLCSLDLTEQVVAEAIQRGAQLILTHHPILFHARKNLREDDPEGRLLCCLVRSGLALIAAHTNYDDAPVGVNDALADALGLQQIELLSNGLRVGNLPQGMKVSTLTGYLSERLQAVIRPYALNDAEIVRLAVCGGAGSEFYPLAKAAGARAYLTGEIHHHDMLAAMSEGMVLFEAGHYETEQIAIKSLANRLQKAAHALQYNVNVIESALRPFAQRI